VGDEAVGGAHSMLCLRLMQLFPRVTNGMRRLQEQAAPATPVPLGPRHVAALEQLRIAPGTVGEIAARLGLTMPTTSGVLAELCRAGLVARHADAADRRRTIVAIVPAKRAVIVAWLDGTAGPLTTVLAKLTPGERAAFVKAMNLLEAEMDLLEAELDGPAVSLGTGPAGSWRSG
jgi:DNA-binding MarR family transcriptional regulator